MINTRALSNDDGGLVFKLTAPDVFITCSASLTSKTLYPFKYTIWQHQVLNVGLWSLKLTR